MQPTASEIFRTPVVPKPDEIKLETFIHNVLNAPMKTYTEEELQTPEMQKEIEKFMALDLDAIIKGCEQRIERRKANEHLERTAFEFLTKGGRFNQERDKTSVTRKTRTTATPCPVVPAAKFTMKKSYDRCKYFI